MKAVPVPSTRVETGVEYQLIVPDMTGKAINVPELLLQRV
jgi:hypothetical protein